MVWDYATVVVMSYLVGSIPSGLLASKLTTGVDIRQYGSGKTGFTNVLRTLGLRPSLLVLLADAAKGFGPVAVVWAIFGSHDLQVAAALAAIVGHDWPILAGFRGGRGVATAYGAYLGMNAPITLSLVAVALAMIFFFRYVSLASVVTVPLGASAFLVLALAGLVPFAYVVYGVLAAAIVILQHRENIRRLLAGTEPKVGQGGRSLAGT